MKSACKKNFFVVLNLALALGAIFVLAPAIAQSPSSRLSPATPGELEELLGPIALYPDQLLANVIAASVYPDEVAEAAKFVASGGKAGGIDGKSWEFPVKAVAKIPDAIKMMGEHPDWTIALGQAYLTQAKDVMDVVQTLRIKAENNGSLVSSPEQQVVVEGQTIYITPTDPEVIHVPIYSSARVYLKNGNASAPAGIVGYGLGVSAKPIDDDNINCNWSSSYVGWGSGLSAANNAGLNAGNANARVSEQNRIGNEGNAWSPNKSKALASSKPSATSRPKMPGMKSKTTTKVVKLSLQPVSKPIVPLAPPSPNRSSHSHPNATRTSHSNPNATRTSHSLYGVGALPDRFSAFDDGEGTRAASQRGNASRAGSSS